MDLAHMLAACRNYERRAADVYRSFATRSEGQPEASALWSALARDEEEHARTLERATGSIAPPEGWRVHLDGWREAMAEIDERLAAAEAVAVGADFDRQLVAALALERTELDRLYHRLAEVTGVRVGTDEHLRRLLSAGEARASPDVQMQVALLRARIRLAGHGTDQRGAGRA